MKCDRCDNPAAVHVTRVRDGRPAEADLCDACAAQVAAVSRAGGPAPQAEATLPPIRHLFRTTTLTPSGQPAPVACQSCGRRAGVHLTEMKDGIKTDRHLCDRCARQARA